MGRKKKFQNSEEITEEKVEILSEELQKMDEVLEEQLEKVDSKKEEQKEELKEEKKEENEEESPINLKELLTNTDSSDSYEKMMDELINDKNIDKKTELNKPISFAVLTVIRDLLEDRKLPNSNKLLANFIKNVYRLLLSKDRQSRKELVEILKSFKQQQDENEKKQNVLGIK